MTSVTRWIFDNGGTYHYLFPRNPNRIAGDTGWRFNPKLNILDVLGANTPTIQVDGFSGAQRTIKFTAITGTMMRKLREFWLRQAVIYNCRDHLSSEFDCFIVDFNAVFHPTTGSFPGSGEDTYDLEVTLLKMG